MYTLDALMYAIPETSDDTRNLLNQKNHTLIWETVTDKTMKTSTPVKYAWTSVAPFIPDSPES